MTRIPDHDPNDRSRRERQVLRALDDAITVDEPLSDALVRRAQELYIWRTFDTELLELLVDSADGELVAMRDDRLQRFMAFGNDERGLHFECLAENGTFVVEGMVVPAGTYTVSAEGEGPDRSVESDELGSFRLTGVGIGPVRLTVRSADGAVTMATPTFTLEA
jgi:hypothetical protein